MKQTALFVVAVTLLISVPGCKGKTTAKSNSGCIDCPQKNEPANTDTLSNQPQCIISIDDKEFSIPADSISTGYTFSDSSLTVTILGVGSGRVVFTIPNFLKCPCKIPTGYSSINTKIAGSDEYAVQPSLTLYSYLLPGISFNNLDDGYHKKEAADNAIDIMAIQKTNENTTTKWAEYLIKGQINTTVLKNVYESAAGDKNKDYHVTGGFVLQTKIYF